MVTVNVFLFFKKIIDKFLYILYIRYMSKYKNIDISIERFSEIFKALSNPNRLKIYLKLLASCKAGEIHQVTEEVCTCIGELGEDLGIVPSTMSHHIKELRRAGLIQIRRQGQRIESWIDKETIEELAAFFKDSLNEL